MRELINKILKHNWHKHFLTFPIAYGVMYLADNYNFLDLGDVGTFAQIFIITFAAFWTACVVEWIQGAFYGAHKTQESWEDGKMDIIVSTVGGFLGTLLYLFT